jgi:hypothetical protein
MLQRRLLRMPAHRRLRSLWKRYRHLFLGQPPLRGAVSDGVRVLIFLMVRLSPWIPWSCLFLLHIVSFFTHRFTFLVFILPSIS